MQITVIGCGYLGVTYAATMADLGHEVLGMEIDPERRAALARGEIPMYEPHLEEILGRAVSSGQLRFTDSYAEVAAFGEVHFVCVGTPQQPEGLAADVSQIQAAMSGLAPHLDRPTLVVGRSTVPVGTAERMAALITELAPAGAEAMLAWNPEFLREGFAVQDTLEPDRIVIGVCDGRAEKMLRDFYAPMIARGAPVVVTDYATAELVKVAANSFLATKVSFINAMAEVCEATGADVVALADAIGHDVRIGRRFLNAGIGFGGGCLPKDIRAFVHRAGELGVEDAMTFLRHVDHINQRQRERVVQVVSSMLGGDLGGARVAIWGASFKPDSDDVRDSPALWVAGQLHLRGAGVRVYDPRANRTARQVFPTLEYAGSAIDACRDADLVLHLTEWPEFREVTPTDLEGVVRRRQLFDGRNVLDIDAWRSAGWTVRAVGRASEQPCPSNDA
jgi:UDPglucose 6-dehydrogenase